MGSGAQVVVGTFYVREVFSQDVTGPRLWPGIICSRSRYTYMYILGAQAPNETQAPMGLMCCVQFQLIPMPVLYGVFLYMGITSLGGVQASYRGLSFMHSFLTFM